MPSVYTPYPAVLTATVITTGITGRPIQEIEVTVTVNKATCKILNLVYITVGSLSLTPVPYY